MSAPSPAASTVDKSGLIDELASQLRQSVQTCAVHSAGPVMTFSRCRELMRSGVLTEEDLKDVGRLVIAKSRARLEERDEEAPSGRAVLAHAEREERVISFIEALFSLEEAGG